MISLLNTQTPTTNIMTIDKYIIQFFNDLGIWGNFALIAISMILTILLVGVIGVEREYRGHNAGLRTHILVALGSCIIMVVSMYSLAFNNEKGVETMRLAATVCTGIGFLGAGVIIQTGTSVKGLTTAATLWMSMSIGLACGSGNFVIATLGTLLCVICLLCFIPLERFINRKNPIIYMSVSSTDASPIKTILTIANRYDVSVTSFESSVTAFEGKEAIRLVIKISRTKKDVLDNFIKDLSTEIKYFELKVA